MASGKSVEIKKYWLGALDDVRTYIMANLDYISIPKFGEEPLITES